MSFNADSFREDLSTQRAELCERNLERYAQVCGMQVALLSRQHVFFLGVPGTGKSALARDFCSSLHGSSYFEWLLTRYSTPEELFGPVSLAGLKADAFRRVTKGKLPEATIAFCDEIWKANSAILNSLLTIVNERKYHNDGVVSVPLEMLIAASNELPETEELAALYDRFLFRFQTQPLVSSVSFASMLTADRRDVGTRVRLEHLESAQELVQGLPLAPNFLDAMFSLRTEINAAGFFVSDRRWKAALRAVRAHAWVEGTAEVDTSQMEILADALWSSPEQRPKVVDILEKYTAGAMREARDIVDAVLQLVDAAMAQKDGERTKRIAAVAREGKQGEERLLKLLNNANGMREQMQVKTEIGRLNAGLVSVRDEARKALGLGT